MMQFRNAQYNAHGTIDCEANHPKLGWIPMTLSSNDAATADIYHEAAKVATEYVAPPDPDGLEV